MEKSLIITIRGRVQGVGFRPFIYSLAIELEVFGTVQNNMDGVRVRIEGTPERLKDFVQDINKKAPRLSRIDEIDIEETTYSGFQDFRIIESEKRGTSRLVIPIDSAVCDDCLDEMRDRENFRYRYPFITCTNCGPRYTIIEELPYDRPATSMADFPMCPSCGAEYHNPLNRRHHAQPIACSQCGPEVKIIDKTGSVIDEADIWEFSSRKLADGAIFSIKGIGGCHLACDAFHSAAVQELRMRKNRPEKPLAVMAANIKAVRAFAELNEQEEKLLLSPEAPIVVLRKKAGCRLSEHVSPGMSTVGVMLPYSPIHHLLFDQNGVNCLVMTSANHSGQPILYEDERLFQDLTGIADYFLLHNRPILHPVDDSVIQWSRLGLDFLRRSRGYAPDPIFVTKDADGMIAFGSQMKNTFSIGRNAQVFIGPHIGDLENVETIAHFNKELDHLLKWINPPIQTAVIDIHPLYVTRKLAERLPFQEIIEVQHHHAHMASCIADNQLEGRLFGIILDGTGYGLDKNIWGFEILYGDESEFTRMAHLDYSPLPGGDKAIKEPWRNAAAMLGQQLGEEGWRLATAIFPEKEADIKVLKAMVSNNINIIMGGTCGRLFDCVSAICGICKVSKYDGEAAIKLSELAAGMEEKVAPYRYWFDEDGEELIFKYDLMLREIVEDKLCGADKAIIAARFIETIARSIAEAIGILSANEPHFSKRAVLSGGSFHSTILKDTLVCELERRGIKAFTHRNIPCSDGGLSFGQIAVAAARRGKANVRGRTGESIGKR